MRNYIEKRNNCITKIIKERQYIQIHEHHTAYKILGDSDFDKCVANVPDAEFIKQVVKHLGAPTRECCVNNLEFYSIYVDMIFKIVLDLYARSMERRLNYSTWFKEFALENDLIFSYEGTYMWCEFDLEHSCYYDLFSRYFLCWLDSIERR